MTKDTLVDVGKARLALIADIGGTNARFAICENLAENDVGNIDKIKTLACANYSSIQSAIHAYLSQTNIDIDEIDDIGIAIANPIEGDLVKMTNHSWQFSKAVLKSKLNVNNLLIINDFSALAMAIPYLSNDELEQIGEGQLLANNVIGVIGAGTGLGVSGLFPTGDKNKPYLEINSEGGHTMFSPANEFECEILRFCWLEFGHVSNERLLSGDGLELLYKAIANVLSPIPEVYPNFHSIVTPALIAQKAREGCPVASEVFNSFSAMLGNVCANLAVTFGCRGGVYLGGGIINHIGDLFNRELFRMRFEEKGRFSEYVSKIATVQIIAQQPALFGIASLLKEKIKLKL